MRISKTTPFQRLAGFQHRGIFNLGRDDVPFGGVGLQGGGNGGVVAFRGARGKNHVARGRSNQFRHLFARRFDDRLEL
jgi:hypothetical protein